MLAERHEFIDAHLKRATILGPKRRVDELMLDRLWANVDELALRQVTHQQVME